MTGKDLFEIISDIDDNYITEAHEEDILNPVASSSSEGASSSSAKAPVPAAPVKRRKLIRIVLPAAAGIAALALAVFGLWKGGIIGGKKDLIEQQCETLTSFTADVTTAVTTVPMSTGDVTTTTEGLEPHVSAECSIIAVSTEPTGNETDTNGDPIVIPDSYDEAHAGLTVSDPSDTKYEEDGRVVISDLDCILTNDGDYPLYYENMFTICIENDEGVIVPVAVFEYESDDPSELCVAPSESRSFKAYIYNYHFPLDPGTYLLVVNVQYFDGEIGDIDSATLLEKYTIAGEFTI